VPGGEGGLCLNAESGDRQQGGRDLDIFFHRTLYF
jgi:hypothetical protein